MPDAPQSREPKELIKPKLLIGEGREEVDFFTALLAHLAITDVQVEEYKGKNGLGSYLKTLRLRSGFAGIVSIGITRDADLDPPNAFKSIRSFLANEPFTAPGSHGVFVGERPKCGIFLMPDGINPGMLEDLCLEAIRNDAASACVEEFLSCVATRANRTPDSPAKARIEARLASLTRPDLRLGQAALDNRSPWDEPAFKPLKDFLKAL
jgi:hypothetical protein